MEGRGALSPLVQTAQGTGERGRAAGGSPEVRSSRSRFLSLLALHLWLRRRAPSPAGARSLPRRPACSVCAVPRVAAPRRVGNGATAVATLATRPTGGSTSWPAGAGGGRTGGRRRGRGATSTMRPTSRGASTATRPCGSGRRRRASTGRRPGPCGPRIDSARSGTTAERRPPVSPPEPTASPPADSDVDETPLPCRPPPMRREIRPQTGRRNFPVPCPGREARSGGGPSRPPSPFPSRPEIRRTLYPPRND